MLLPFLASLLSVTCVAAEIPWKASDPAPNEITLLGIFPFSGGWSVGADIVPAFELAIEDINASPNILPNTTLLGVTEDDQCSKQGGILAPLSHNGPLGGDSSCAGNSSGAKYFDAIIGSGACLALHHGDRHRPRPPFTVLSLYL